MQLFLEESSLWIHPNVYMPLNTFFQYFNHFCIENFGSEIKGVRYKDVWNEFGLAITRKIKKPYPIGSDTMYYGRFIMGIMEPANDHDCVDQVQMDRDLKMHY